MCCTLHVHMGRVSSFFFFFSSVSIVAVLVAVVVAAVAGWARVCIGCSQHGGAAEVVVQTLCR